MNSAITRVCFIGVYGHTQNAVLRGGLAAHGVTVTEAGISTKNFTLAGRHLPLYPMKPTLHWFGRFPSPLLPVFFALTFLLHAVVTWTQILANISAVRRADVLVVPHLGDTAVLAVKPLAVLLDRPLVYISHNGLYFTLVENREAFEAGSIAGQFLHLIDELIQRSADRIVVFSKYSGAVLSDAFGVPERKYGVVYIGVDDTMLPEAPEVDRPVDVDVLYWGNFIPHHGVRTMIHAANSLPDNQFVFAGESNDRASIIQEAEDLGLENVDFPGFLPKSSLVNYIDAATVVLGPLGDYTQTSMNIGSKVAEAAYLQKAIVLGDHPAPNELFEHEQSAMLVKPDDAEALVAAIRGVQSDEHLQARLETGAYSVYEAYFAAERNAAQFLSVADEVV